MKKMILAFKFLLLVITAVSLISCATCKSAIPYREDLSDDPQLRDANESYKKATRMLDEAGCKRHYPAEAKEDYRKADSYLSDAVYKLEQAGYDEELDVSEEVYYAQELKREIGVQMGLAEKETTLGP